MNRTSLLLSLILLSLSSCKRHAPDTPPPSFAGERYDTAAIHLSLTTDRDCLPLIYAKRTGLFDSLGVKVQIAVYRSQADADTALLGKLCDGGMADEVRLRSYGKRATGFQAIWKSHEARTLLVNGKLRIKGVKGLKGHTIAVPRISAEAGTLDAALRGAGLHADDVYRPQIGDLALRTAMLLEGQYDATVLAWPYASWAVAAGAHSIYRQSRADGSKTFVMKPARLRRATARGQWQLLERGRRMALDSLRIKGNRAYSLILQKDYGLPREVADTIRFAR